MKLSPFSLSMLLTISWMRMAVKNLFSCILTLTFAFYFLYGPTTLSRTTLNFSIFLTSTMQLHSFAFSLNSLISHLFSLSILLYTSKRNITYNH